MSISRIAIYAFIIGALLIPYAAEAGKLYTVPRCVHSRWTSSENPTGKKGAGGKANHGAKGHPYDKIAPGGKITLLNVKGAGIVNRMKLTLDDRSPYMLRALRVEMYWDGAKKPAVSAPLGDFFGLGLGQTAAYHNALFSNPEGRSFNSFVPMPFKTGARIVIANDSKKEVEIFYNVNFQRWSSPHPHTLYFHAYWHRERRTKLGKDYKILPRVSGRGRFLGTNIGVITNPVYKNTWWGEGEVKMYLDGDKKYPSLVGTGTEDYIGTAWGQGKFIDPYQGSIIANKIDGEWAFYRYHIPDPIYFHKNIEVTIQPIGGGPKDKVKQLVNSGAPMKLITVDTPKKFVKLLDKKSPPNINAPNFPKGWVNFYRRDDWSSVAYFYLNQATEQLPPIAPLKVREAGISEAK